MLCFYILDCRATGIYCSSTLNAFDCLETMLKDLFLFALLIDEITKGQLLTELILKRLLPLSSFVLNGIFNQNLTKCLKNLVPRCRLWDSMQGEKYFSFISDEFLCRGSCSVSKVKTCIILQNKCWLLTASVALQMFSVTWKDFIEQGRCSLFAKSYFSLIECNNVGTK